MSKTAAPLIVFLTREGLSICSETAEKPITLKFGRDLVSDLEVTNPAQLSVEIKKIFDAGKLKPGNLTLILSESIYFERSYPKPNAPSEKELEDFVDTIPFSSVSSKLVNYGNAYHQIVINRDFYETIIMSLEQLGFKITGIIPAFVLGLTGNNLTADACRAIYKKLDQALVFGSLMAASKNDPFGKKEQVFMEKNKILIIIITALLVLMAIGTAVFTLMPPSGKTKPKSSTLVIPKAPVVPTPVPLPPEPTTPSAQILDSLTVQIVNASGIAGRAASLSALLKSRGITDIQTGNSGTRPAVTSIAAAPDTALSVGEYVRHLISSLYPDPVLSTDSAAKSDLIITIGTK